MEIVEQHWEEEKLKVNETKFIKSKITMDQSEEDTPPSILESLDSIKIPLLGSGGAVIFLIILAIILLAAIKSKSPLVIQTSAGRAGSQWEQKEELDAICQKEEDCSFKNKQSTLIGSTNRHNDKYNDEGYSSEEEELICDIK